MVAPIRGGPAELSRNDDERLVEFARDGQVVQERGDALIERREQIVLEPTEIAGVRIPVLNPAHVGLHDRNAGLDEPSSQEYRLSEQVPAVSIASLGVLEADVEGAGDLSRQEHRVGMLALLGHGIAVFRGRKRVSAGGELVEKNASTIHPFDTESDRRRETFFPKIGLVGVLLDLERVVLRTQKSRVLAGPGERPLHQISR